jgi:hypothetical protein
VVFKEENRKHQQAGRKTMKINKNDTAVVVIEPQNDVLRETGVGWDFVGTSSPAFPPE